MFIFSGLHTEREITYQDFMVSGGGISLFQSSTTRIILAIMAENLLIYKQLKT